MMRHIKKDSYATFSTSLLITVRIASFMPLESGKVVPSTYLEIHKESVPVWLTQHDHFGTLVRASDKAVAE
jgi:hypothetical protein